jgi:hypothetical protein
LWTATALLLAWTIGVIETTGPERIFAGYLRWVRDHPELVGIPREELDLALADLPAGLKYLAYAFVLLGVPGFILITAASLLPAVRWLGGRMTFRQSAAVVAHASLPPAAVLLVFGGLWLWMRPESVHGLERLAPLNLGLVVSPQAGRFWHALAFQTDLPTGLFLGLLAEGISRVGQAGRSKVIAALGGLWLMTAILVAACAAVL